MKIEFQTTIADSEGSIDVSAGRDRVLVQAVAKSGHGSTGVHAPIDRVMFAKLCRDFLAWHEQAGS